MMDNGLIENEITFCCRGARFIIKNFFFFNNKTCTSAAKSYYFFNKPVVKYKCDETVLF
jgi:hypothetical protein